MFSNDLVLPTINRFHGGFLSMTWAVSKKLRRLFVVGESFGMSAFMYGYCRLSMLSVNCNSSSVSFLPPSNNERVLASKFIYFHTMEASKPI